MQQVFPLVPNAQYFDSLPYGTLRVKRSYAAGFTTKLRASRSSTTLTVNSVQVPNTSAPLSTSAQYFGNSWRRYVLAELSL
ncbi:MAG: hypothetical protein V7L20_00305 [Nostoc sp.]|uniref:hypothetical protein n=1 Tax=Nostoc sp. TaxID=1180 RepID=UPI002FFAA851